MAEAMIGRRRALAAFVHIQIRLEAAIRCVNVRGLREATCNKQLDTLQAENTS